LLIPLYFDVVGEGGTKKTLSRGPSSRFFCSTNPTNAIRIIVLGLEGILGPIKCTPSLYKFGAEDRAIMGT
jgi:hypothetical protein